MSESKSCSRCGTELNPGTVGGLCPRCLMALNFDSYTLAEGEGEEHSPAPPLSPEEMGQHFPQFENIAYLGRGGMGVVYQAKQKTLDRLVAIKILAGEWQGDDAFAKRFEREAKILAQMNHPNIVTVHDFGETNGLYFIVMEFIDGVNLRDLLREGKLDPEQALSIVPPICEALEYAHGKGIVHRDIKPENLLLDREGRIKIADFGIADLVGSSSEKNGTPPYMAPEQQDGHSDERADIYALGVVLYEMLTGERPAQNFIAPSQKSGTNSNIDGLVMRAMEKDPEQRFQTAEEFRTLVENENQNQPPQTQTLTTPPQKARGSFRRFWWAFLVAIPLSSGLGILLALGVFSFLPKSFEATTVVRVTNYSTPDDIASLEVNSFFATQHAILTAKKQLTRVVENHDLEKKWMVTKGEAIAVLRQATTLRRRKGTDLIEITFIHRNQGEVADLANAIATSYLERIAEAELGSVMMMERASPPKNPSYPKRLPLLSIGAGLGLLLSPILGLFSILLLKKMLPETSRAISRPRTSPTAKWALWLLLAALLLSPILLALTPNERQIFILIFAILSLAGSFICSLASLNTRLGRRLLFVHLSLFFLNIIAILLVLGIRLQNVAQGESTSQPSTPAQVIANNIEARETIKNAEGFIENACNLAATRTNLGPRHPQVRSLREQLLPFEEPTQRPSATILEPIITHKVQQLEIQRKALLQTGVDENHPNILLAITPNYAP